MSATDTAATILLVEDDAPTRTFLADNLTADGYELLVADCARDGLRLLETKFPDVALVDLGLPDGSGLDIVRRVRSSDGVASRIDPALPLVVLSGRVGELDRLGGFERGCDDYVCKVTRSVPSGRTPRRIRGGTLVSWRPSMIRSLISGARYATPSKSGSASGHASGASPSTGM
jgi:CheY-like chemotaxis protein